MCQAEAIGIASNISPVYLSEINPPAWRGMLVSLNQFMIVVGILGAQIVNWRLAKPIPAVWTTEQMQASWNGHYRWRWMFTAVAVPSLVFLLRSLFIPESPRWLAKRNRLEKSSAGLERIYGDKSIREV